MLEFDFELELELDIRLGADNGNDSSNDVSHNSNERNFGKSSRQFGNLHDFEIVILVHAKVENEEK